MYDISDCNWPKYDKSLQQFHTGKECIWVALAIHCEEAPGPGGLNPGAWNANNSGDVFVEGTEPNIRSSPDIGS